MEAPRSLRAGSQSTHRARWSYQWGGHGEHDGDGDDRSRMRDKAVQQALAAWLNYASGAVGWGEMVTIEGDDDDDGPAVTMTFADAMAQVEAVLLDPEATHHALVGARDIAESVNELDEDNPACKGDDEDEEEDGDDGGEEHEDDGDGHDGHDKDSGDKDSGKPNGGSKDSGDKDSGKPNGGDKDSGKSNGGSKDSGDKGKKRD